jgi:hypothetical protein
MISEKAILGILEEFKPSIRGDFTLYANHVCRVYLNCIATDKKEENAEKYAFAAIFHDIGIWTNKTFDYLEPSIHQAEEYLKGIKRGDLVNEVSEMIYWHHKVTSYTGNFALTVENFREADWVDVSIGLVKFGRSRKIINQNTQRYPFNGFHRFLVRKAMMNFFKHPLNPLPMFKV